MEKQQALDPNDVPGMAAIGSNKARRTKEEGEGGGAGRKQTNEGDRTIVQL